MKDADKIWPKADKLFNTALKGCTKNAVYADFEKILNYQNATLDRKDADTYIRARYNKYKTFITTISTNMMKEWNMEPVVDYRAVGMYMSQIAQYLDLAPNNFPSSEVAFLQ